MKSTKIAGLGAALTGAVLAGAAAVAFPRVIRPWYLGWGASEEEAARRLPGDEIVPEPRSSYTRAITIRAPVDQVWGWLAIKPGGGFATRQLLLAVKRRAEHMAEGAVKELEGV